MKSQYLLFTAITLFILGCFSAFVHRNNQRQSSQLAQGVKAEYLDKLLSFSREAAQLHTKAENLHEKDAAAVDALQKSLLNTRNAYKKTEFLAAYLDAEFVDDYINGPPLLSLERNSPSLSVLAPEGIQVLEELFFSELPFDHQEEILHLTNALADNAQKFQKFQRQVYLTDRHIFEAARFHLVRLFTLGLTGFDAPVASDPVQEAFLSLKGMSEAIQVYYPVIAQKDEKLSWQLQSKMNEALYYLNDNPGFEDFDRLFFLKTYINPLYKSLLEAQMALHIETYYETSPLNKKHSVNYFEDNIFSENFLNPYFYTELFEQRDTEKLRELGRYLFFDPALSVNNERSCASCHQPGKGFTDGLAKSHALNFEGTIDRNAPTLLNAAYADRYFYDLRADMLEDQIQHVITDEREFHTTYLDIFEKLSKSDEYVGLFRESFPEIKENTINEYTISTALTSYIVSLKSFNSPFDKYVRGETEAIDSAVKRGFNLFMGKANCGTCHFAPVFNGTVPPLYHESESEVLGVPVTADTLQPVMDTDLGRFRGVLKEHAYFYKNSFKTTTVRNVELTAPYMHNGVYKTLEEVVDFYDKGGGIGLGMDVPFQTLPHDPLNLSEQEKNDIVAFMKALTDTTEVKGMPRKLPVFANRPDLNSRPVGGVY